jgi:hypothetical protein
MFFCNIQQIVKHQTILQCFDIRPKSIISHTKNKCPLKSVRINYIIEPKRSSSSATSLHNLLFCFFSFVPITIMSRLILKSITIYKIFYIWLCFEGEYVMHLRELMTFCAWQRLDFYTLSSDAHGFHMQICLQSSSPRLKLIWSYNSIIHKYVNLWRKSHFKSFRLDQKQSQILALMRSQT